MTVDFPIIKTTLPGPKSKEYIRRDSACIAPAVGVRWLPVVIEREYGTFMEDIDGNVFIDFLSGAAAAITGYCHPKIVEAVTAQVRVATHICDIYHYSKTIIELAEEICRLTPGSFPKKVIWGLAGSDANDGALKVVRYHTKRPRVLAYLGSYHGQTYGALSLSGVFPNMKRGFGPIVQDIFHVPFAYCYRCQFGLRYPKCNLYCARYIEEIVFENLFSPEEIAAIFTEPIQGDAGIVVPPPDYFSRVMEMCRKHGILFVADEVQTGWGRTGKLWGAEHFNIQPDVMILGKGLASGIGLAAVVGKAEIMTMPPGSHALTPAANPIMVAASHATLTVLEEEKLVENSIRIGNLMMKELREMGKEHELIGEIRGRGLMIGVELVRDQETREPASEECMKVCYRAFEKGLILPYYGLKRNVIRITPALTITEEVAKKGLEIFEQALKDVESGVVTKLAVGW
ncbi:MAG: Glutamate-1-semialdehyde 2,1-aminomutase [Candidatus Bathyarchaeota archaeon BA1]|nr:MAG: Glutamate-1-semialdehyde 2,1-aminomutase [Candidatus Bathyarchaeota archaeon BA1]